MKPDSKEIITALETYGLTKNEATVYVSLLKKLESTAFEIAKQTEIPRATVYLTLDSLKKQNIISQFRKNNVAYFTPESPSQLTRLLKKKEEVLNEIMPQIRAITSQNIETPTTKLYVGLDGIKTGLEDILETLKEQKIKQIQATSQPDLLTYLPKYFPHWLKQREDLRVYTRLILPAHARNYLSTNALREVKYLPDKFPFTCSVTIYNKKVAFFSLEGSEPYSVILESESVAHMFAQFFSFTWEMLKTE